MADMTGGEALAAQLVREGVSMLFGVPGVQLDWAFDGLYKEREHIKFVGPRHEQATTYMADGYARTRGEVGVAMVVPGPGMLNASAGLATAYSASSPVLLIAGQIDSRHIGEGLGLLHEIPDQTGILRSLTKWTARVTSPADIPGLVQEAFRQLRSGRPRPVALEVPPDILAARADVALLDPVPLEGFRTRPDAARIQEAAALLRRAERPVILVGGGIEASGAAPELARLAEVLQAPVVMSNSGRGAISDRHPLALPSIAGGKILPEADLVLAVGTRFTGSSAQAVPAGTPLILMNVDERDLNRHGRARVAILSDAREGLEALSDELDGLPRRPGPWLNLETVRDACAADIETVQPQAQYVRALRAAIPDDGILVSELTQVGYLSRIAYPVYVPRTFIHPGYQGTLGYGFPTALGIKMGLPDRAVVSITGDGGFGWGNSELATMRKYNIGVVTVIFNDKAFGNVKRTQKYDFEGRMMGTDLVNPDYVKLADAYGIRGLQVDGPEALEGALKEAIAADEPCLIEVPVGEMDSPWGLVMGRPAIPARP